MTLTVIAVYKEDQETDFKLILLTESADYLKLTRSLNDIFNFNPDNTNNDITSDDFIDNIDPENIDTNECLNNKGFICSQLWEISAIDIGCIPDGKGTDFSGNYQLSFVPECRSTGNTNLDNYCSQWLIDHPDIATRVTLDTDLIWHDDICDPIIFTVQFVAVMSFYQNDNFDSVIADDHLYQVGEDTIYVQIDTTFPSDTMDVFNTELVQVHICTFDPLNPPSEDLSDLSTFGCFGNRDTEYDEYFFKIYDSADSNVNLDSFQIETEGISNIVRFSFVIPHEVARDTLYIQAELEVELQELGRRRRILLSSITEPTANQIDNFIDKVGINHGQEPESPFNNKNNKPHNEYYPQEPINPITNPVSPPVWTINLSSPWIIGIGSILGLILIFNIVFMCYVNCCNDNNVTNPFSRIKRRGYNKVKIADSEIEDIDNSEMDRINVASE